MLDHSIWPKALLFFSFALLHAGCSHLRDLPLTRRVAPPAAQTSTTDSLAGEGVSPENVADIHVAVAQSAELRGDVDLAIELYYKSLEKDDTCALAYHRLALLHDKTGDHQTAARLYREARLRAPDEAEIHCDLGYNCYLQGQWQEAEQSLAMAIRLRPDFKRAHNNLGLLLARTGQVDRALYEFANSKTSEHDARANVALAMLIEGDADSATQQLDLAMRANPGPESESASASRLRGLAQTVSAALADAGPPGRPIPAQFSVNR